MVLERVAHEGVGLQAPAECRIKVVQADHVDLQGVELIEEMVVETPRVAVGGGYDVAGVLRAVLIIVGCLKLRTRDMGAVEEAARQAQETGKTEARRHSEFGASHVIAGTELEVAEETQIEAFAAVEDILVVVVDLGRDADKARGVGRSLEVGLEALDPGRSQTDVAVDRVAGDLGQFDSYAAEELEVAVAVVGVIDLFLIVEASGTDCVEIGYDLLAELESGGIGDRDLDRKSVV